MMESITVSDLSTSYDLSTLSLEEGDHEVFVKGWAENYEDSSASNTVIYTVEEGAFRDGYRITVKATSGIDYLSPDWITEGEHFPWQPGDHYNVNYDGTLYENLEAGTIDVNASGQSFTLNYVGNLGAFMFRSALGRMIDPADKEGVVENDLPFVMLDRDDADAVLYGFVAKPAGHVITVVDANDSSKTYTLTLSSEVIVDNGNVYVIPETVEQVGQKIGGFAIGKPQDIVVDGVTYSGVMAAAVGTNAPYLKLDGYEQEDDQPVIFGLGSEGLEAAYVSVPHEINQDVLVEIPAGVGPVDFKYMENKGTEQSPDWQEIAIDLDEDPEVDPIMSISQEDVVQNIYVGEGINTLYLSDTTKLFVIYSNGFREETTEYEVTSPKHNEEVTYVGGGLTIAGVLEVAGMSKRIKIALANPGEE